VSGFETVIGLEVHAHLATRSKLFCPCAVGYGDDPNRNTCPVCLALPGALPVLNERAVELAIRAALVTHCSVQPRSVFARKNYFYPDLPKGYQISQYEEPLALGGWLEIAVDGASEPRRIGLTRIHLEEDAGKSIHEGLGRDGTRIDLNRAGVPLIEIVSEPDLRSAEEAGAYLRALHAILRAVGASDADLEKGHFRCDANVSLRRPGAPLGTRTELKNLNSFRAVEGAVRGEIERQREVLEGGGRVRQATLRYELATERISVMRLKENADDYRYFPDPDLVPLALPPERVDAVRAALPELPEARRARFAAAYGLPEADARQLVASRALAGFFEAAVRAGGAPRTLANWLLRDVTAALREAGRELDEAALTPEQLAALASLVDAGRVTPGSARGLLPELLTAGGDVAALVRERGLEAVSDAGQLEAVVAEVLAEQPKAVASFRAGDEKALHFLMGQVMRKTKGKADATRVRELLTARLGSGS
jgi:aspartyl-tRNA(Asn)/glutamyl-tRNA(Gln) amidotransferase subunit B